MYQISFFDDEPLTWFQECLLLGSLTEGGKQRIYNAALTLPFDEFVTYVKDEYGWCGSSTRDGFMDCNSQGMRIFKFKSDYEENYTWKDVAKGIKKLISMDKYLDKGV